MKVNIDYLRAEVGNPTSELWDKLLKYDGVLPNDLFEFFNPNINFLDLNIPLYVKQAIMRKHEENWVNHRRYELFNKPGESFSDCDNRLIQELVDKTGLPIFE